MREIYKRVFLKFCLCLIQSNIFEHSENYYSKSFQVSILNCHFYPDIIIHDEHLLKFKIREALYLCGLPWPRVTKEGIAKMIQKLHEEEHDVKKDRVTGTKRSDDLESISARILSNNWDTHPRLISRIRKERQGNNGKCLVCGQQEVRENQNGTILSECDCGKKYELQFNLTNKFYQSFSINIEHDVEGPDKQTFGIRINHKPIDS